MDSFFEEDSFDVLFLGSSHVINGVFPMQLWKDYGIISYNLGQHATYLAGSYYNMLLACREKKPKMIVIDTYSINVNNKTSTEEYSHKLLDTYPMSYTKYLAIKDLFGKDNLLENEINYLFNFSIYHSRWNELDKNDFVKKLEYEKGAKSRIDVAIPNKIKEVDSVDIENINETINMEYLRKIIEYCQKEKIKVLVTYLPHPATKEQIAGSIYVQNICNEYNVNYINFLLMDTVNYDVDCYDIDSHLNPSGAKKITSYLGKYIQENYDIPDQRDNEKYDFWYEDYNKYIDLKINNLRNNKNNLNNYLMLLYGEEDIKYEIKISSKKDIKEESVLKKLLLNLNNNYEINDNAFEKRQDKTIKIMTYDNRDGKLIDTVWF